MTTYDGMIEVWHCLNVHTDVVWIPVDTFGDKDKCPLIGIESYSFEKKDWPNLGYSTERIFDCQ